MKPREGMEGRVFAHALYVPDEWVRALRDLGTVGRFVFDKELELDFIPPPWWEDSHTAKLVLTPHLG